jgi:hypothetical protein
MTYRDLMENHADIVYHTVAALAGVIAVGIGVIAAIRYLKTGSIDSGIWGGCAGLTTIATFFAGAGVANAKFNPNNS